eukprot:TRINITY_DN45258_c0_g1_i1.p2 TRINITY_DN45258_c0_g1~~TRINITY_DN45258_c0_g1_i1.p2  ORF type:complete len:147 (-),score=37.41 TRINITY_DN45258_c0_g1_i1:477-917(-)
MAPECNSILNEESDKEPLKAIQNKMFSRSASQAKASGDIDSGPAPSTLEDNVPNKDEEQSDKQLDKGSNSDNDKNIDDLSETSPMPKVRTSSDVSPSARSAMRLLPADSLEDAGPIAEAVAASAPDGGYPAKNLLEKRGTTNLHQI